MSHPLVVSPLDSRQLLGALKSTGSTDPDVLYAKKEELLAETRSKRTYGTPLIVIGTIMTLMIIMAPLGIPSLLWGLWTKRRINQNIQTADSVYADYVRSVGGRPRTGS